MANLNGIKNRVRTPKGFTLLEIIIVIIIIGVLASLALPRYAKTVEYARGFEALVTLGTLRQSLNRYYIPTQHYGGATLSNLDIEDPNIAPGTHFTYTLTLPAGPTPLTYIITATRNNFENTTPPTPGTITIDQDGRKTGSGSYAAVR